MSGMIFKVKHYRSFTTVSNDWINNPKLSAKAKGILLYLLSKPHDWETNLEDIAAHMRDGIDSIKSGLKELKQSRHIVKIAIRENGKISGWETLVFEEPLPEVENPLSGFSTNWITHKWKNHHVENPLQLNTKDIYLSKDLDTEELNTEQKPNNRSAANAGGSILAAEAGRGLSEKTSESRKSSKKKKQAKPREYGYLRVFGDDEAMKQDFVALYAAHPKHARAREAAEAYYRLRRAGATSEEIVAAHQEALEGAWKGRAIQFYPKLSDWLADALANRDLGIESDRPALLYPDHYRQVRDEYFRVCCELDAPFGNEERAQAMWNAQVRDSERTRDGIVEATAHYLEKKRNREGEPISRFERYLQHRWQVALAHKQLQSDSAPTTVARDFLPWFRLAVAAGVTQNFSTSDISISGLPAGCLGVMRAGSERWEDWRAIAQEYPVERLQRLKAEREDPDSIACPLTSVS